MRTVFICIIVAVSTISAAMVDPAIDDPNGQWCYLARSTTVIGVPFVPEPVQVTYDGAIYTRNAELCFFYGEKNTPVMARQKTFLDGWIPVVRYDFEDGDISYDVEIFSAIVPPLESDNVVQFVRMTMRNVGAEDRTGIFTSAIRGSGEIDRLGGSRWSMTPAAKLSFDANSFIRDGRIVYTFSEGAQRYATPKSAYEKPFTGATHSLGNRNETGLVRYSKRLLPGQTYSAYFKMPRNFISTPADTTAVKNADYDAFRDKTVAYWKELIGAAVMSFDLVRKAFVHEYKCRFSEHLKAGGKRLEIKAPEMAAPSVVSASAYLGNHPPAKAFDGNHTDLDSSWQTDPYPAWLTIDLEKSKMINLIHVYPYWGSRRYYRYTVEVSKDGENWLQVADKSKNTAPSTPAGDEFAFEPVETRYIRVNMLYHNLNKGVHIVEVQAFEAEKK